MKKEMFTHHSVGIRPRKEMIVRRTNMASYVINNGVDVVILNNSKNV